MNQIRKVETPPNKTLHNKTPHPTKHYKTKQPNTNTRTKINSKKFKENFKQ